MATAQPNHRASLLSGLRTGGVRSVSVPHTAAPTGSFNIQRVASNGVNQSNIFLSENRDSDQLADIAQQRAFAARNIPSVYQAQTAGLDGTEARFSFQQQENYRPTQYLPHMATDNHAPLQQQQASNPAQLQMQLMQMEIMRIQAVAQMQQIASMQVEAARSQTLQGWGRDNSEPATAGPIGQSFAHVTHGQNIRQLQAMTGYSTYDTVPMTAALGGRFGGRHQPESLYAPSSGHPAQPNTKINHHTPAAGMTQSKSDSAVSWRRGSTVENVDLLSKSTQSTAASSKCSPPTSDSERGSSPEAQIGLKSRPRPLLLSSRSAVNAQVVSSAEDSEPGDDSSSSKSDEQGSSSSPTTPLSGNSQESSMSAREEASKKLFQGLGIGRPSIHVTAPAEAALSLPLRSTSQLIRQPRGPPSASEEFRDKNFANRIRKKAIGGLGALMEAREKRDVVQEAEA